MKVTSKEATNNCNSTTSCNIESVEKQSDECNSFLDDESLLDIGINDLTCLFLPESNKHICCGQTCGKVTLNISGLKFQTQMRTLKRLPDTLLGNDTKRQKYWDPVRLEYFFDRHRPSFSAILYFYQSGGRLIRPVEVPPDVFLEEIQFFEMGKAVIQSYMVSEGLLTMTESKSTHKATVCEKIWWFLEYPETSLGAKIFAGISITFIVISVVTFCVETLPQYRNTGCVNITTIRPVSQLQGNKQLVPNFAHPLSIIESVCMAWFVLEFLVRFLFCPSKLGFVKSLINWIDFAAIVPYFVYLFMYIATGECYNNNNTMAILRVLRVVRTLKLSKHSQGLKILAKTLRASMNELFLFALCLGISIILFSFAMFYAEHSIERTQFTSIPATFWWAVITMTTVGYGDMYPEEFLGKIIGIFTLLTGILSFALPLPVIIKNFNNLYH